MLGCHSDLSMFYLFIYIYRFPSSTTLGVTVLAGESYSLSVPPNGRAVIPWAGPFPIQMFP